MSTKTLKRIALVAVSALGFGLVSVAPSNAAAADITVGTAYASGGTATARTATQLAGTNNFVTYTVETAAVGTPLAIVTTGGTASCVSTAGTHSFAGNGSANVIVTTVTAGAPSTVTCTTVTSTVGTVTAKVFGFTNGAQNATSTSSLTITVIDPASLALTTLTVYSVANGGCAGAPTASTITYLPKGAALGSAELCVTAKDGNLANMASAVAVTVSSNLGYLDSDGDGGTTVSSAVGGATIAAGTASAAFDIGGNGVSGTGTYTVTATSGGKTLTGTVSIKFFDDVAKITLTQLVNSYNVSTASAVTGFATFKAEDKNGFPVALILAAGEGSFSVSSDVGGVSTGMASDKSTSTWSAASNNSVTALGVETAGVLAVTTGATTEMQTVSIVNSSIVSNALTLYTAGAAVAASELTASDATPGTQQTVSVTFRDAKGYPIADGSAVTFTATTGTIGNAATTNGVATATFTAPVVGGLSVDLKATQNLISATKTIKIDGGNLQQSIDAATDAAAEAIDAANAATDAANLAAEAADAATVAAEEARDAADAATAAVEELATQVATLMAALKAQLTTLANTVAKIAKKVKA